jgi:predicted dehydrogenase
VTSRSAWPSSAFFGAEFIPIYQNYPGVEIHAICRRNRKGLDEVGDRFGIAVRYTD